MLMKNLMNLNQFGEFKVQAKVIGVPNVICSQCRCVVATYPKQDDQEEEPCERCGLTLKQVYASIQNA